MKRIKRWMMLIAVAVLLFVCGISAAAEAATGDVNADGNVNLQDVLMMRKYLANVSCSPDLVAADMNKDGAVNTKDLLLLRKKIADFSPVEPVDPKVLATGTVMKITTDFTETFSGDVTGDYSSPTNAYLPAGTLDVLKKEVTDPETGYTYYLLGCGRRVYTDDAEIYKNDGSLTENKLTTAGVFVSIDTTIVLNASWCVPFQLQFKPQEYPQVNQMGDFGPKYDITSFTANYIDITFSYTTAVSGLPSVSNSPLFSSAKWIYNNDNTYTLRLTLRKTGAFYGYHVEWKDNQLVFSFKHKTDISKNTASKPLAGMTIVVDAGHGGEWSGTYGVTPGLYEKTLTLQYAKKLQTKLQSLGATVVMTRTTDKKVEMHDVTTITRNAKPDLFVSIHMDGVDDPGPNGPTDFYYNEYSAALARSIISKMDAVFQSHKKTTYRGAKWNPYYVTRVSDCPAVLVECGFMTNPVEEKLMIDDSFQNEIVAAIADGIIEFQKNLP